MIDAAASPASAGADSDADEIASGDVGVDVIAVADEIIEEDARYVVTIKYLLAGIATLLFIIFLLLCFVYEFSLVGFDMLSSTFETTDDLT